MAQDGAVLATKGAAAAAAADAGIRVFHVPTPDPMLFGLLPEPLFYGALLGAAIGVFLMDRGTADKLSERTGATQTGRALGTVLKMLALAATVVGFACLTAGLMTAVLDYLTDGPSVTSSPGWIGGAIVLGAFIKPLLPKLQAAWERAIDASVGAYERVIGGGK
jgi:hypothetical protein